MNKKIKVGIIFGGKSTEHEISIKSAKNIVSALDKEKYEVSLININKNGVWALPQNHDVLQISSNPQAIADEELGPESSIIPVVSPNLLDVHTDSMGSGLDVIFPILHGTYGEDGSIQGFLKLLNIPFVGADILSSAVGMDKEVAKRLLAQQGILVADFIVLKKKDFKSHTYDSIIEKLGSPFFVKPCNSGSSVGVSKVYDYESYIESVKEAFKYDKKILVEEFVNGREIECAVIGNDDPQASILGEIIPTHDFYSYDAKYVDENGAVLKIPADLSSNISDKIRALAINVYESLNCEGMARVDFFLTAEEDVVVNEINTIPGFTDISMFPKLWEHSGVSKSELLDKLIKYALERHEKDSEINFSTD